MRPQPRPEVGAPHTRDRGPAIPLSSAGLLAHGTVAGVLLALCCQVSEQSVMQHWVTNAARSPSARGDPEGTQRAGQEPSVVM